MLSIFIGTMRWEYVEVPADLFYQSTLLDYEQQFWQAVQARESPAILPPVEAPKKACVYREIDMTGRNEWAALAHDWVRNREAAQTFDHANAGLKQFMEADVGVATGHGVKVFRKRNGHLIVSEHEAKRTA
ncbi:MAG: hypothetical protein ACRD3W_22805 [Terriglobales bacterium]